MRFVVISALLVLAACTQPPQQSAVAALQDCTAMQLPTGELTPGECKLEAAGQALHVTFASVAAGSESGAISVDVLDENGRVAQTLLESGLSEYVTPQVQDVDGDGRADILIARESGTVNITQAVWIYDGAGRRYNRVGEVSGVSVDRTEDGYIGVPARSSAASWNVYFYRLDQAGLHPLVTLQVDGEPAPSGISETCALTEAPGLGELHLDRRAAEAKFCAEPIAGVFGE